MKKSNSCSCFIIGALLFFSMLIFAGCGHDMPGSQAAVPVLKPAAPNSDPCPAQRSSRYHNGSLVNLDGGDHDDFVLGK